jgi:Fe-S oxidoreductase/nitrate reductase gamma subunit
MNPVLMSLLLIIATGALVFSLLRRFLPLWVMQPENRLDQPGKRLMRVLTVGIGQKRFFQRFELPHGIIHILIFWGFLAVSINTIHLVGRGYASNWSLPFLHNTFLGLAYAGIKDLFVLLVMVGTCAALFRRIFFKPQRMTLGWEPNLILVWIFIMMVLDVLYGATLFIIFPELHEQHAAFLGLWGKAVLTSLGLGEPTSTVHLLNDIGMWAHIFMVLAFLNYLPYGKHFHIITALPNVFLFSTKNKGELVRQDFENEETIFGVGNLQEMSFKRGLDMYTCTECGRCQANCPAHLSEKPLSPKSLMLDLREHLKRRTPEMCRAALQKIQGNGQNAAEILDNPQGEALIGDVISDEVLWACTTCGHCVENCPTLIEHVDNIVDMRRYLVQVEGRLPKELITVFKCMENMSNPWGVASNTRADWFESLGVQTPAQNPDFDYLLYVGCAGSFDKRNKKVTTAVVRLLQQAGINFACLGNDESCCGETARRLGNEYLAQSMMESNVAQWKELGVEKVITACPHCFNTINNEYHQFSGDFQILHHTQLLAQLIDQSRLTPQTGAYGAGPVVYHDACYLGRYNGVYDAPRQILSTIPQVRLVEPERRKRVSFCCGAGGGRMWMEENIGKRINTLRCEQLLETGAVTLATACPYCLTMLEDAVKDKALEERIKVRDISELIGGHP